MCDNISDYSYLEDVDHLSEKEIFNIIKKNKDVFVETGSRMGNGIRWAMNHFEKIYSIELYEPHYNHCKERFSGHTKVNLYHGNSKDKLKNILQNISEPCVFWLDAHGDRKNKEQTMPIFDELEIISTHHIKSHVILIDDVRLFGTRQNPGPEADIWIDVTMDRVFKKLKKINENYVIFKYHDVLCAVLEEDFDISYVMDLKK